MRRGVSLLIRPFYLFIMIGNKIRSCTVKHRFPYNIFVVWESVFFRNLLLCVFELVEIIENSLRRFAAEFADDDDSEKT